MSAVQARSAGPSVPAIEIAQATKIYRTRDGEVPSLRPINCSVLQGEFVVVVGPSGCGKSTLLKLLAGGMQQRVSICRALVHDPTIILMDEPFGALDALTRERMNVELARIQQETHKTVLMITHSIPEAVFLADRVIVMSERPGSIAAIYDNPLPSPRALTVMADPRFTALVAQIREHFYARGGLD